MAKPPAVLKPPAVAKPPPAVAKSPPGGKEVYVPPPQPTDLRVPASSLGSEEEVDLEPEEDEALYLLDSHKVQHKTTTTYRLMNTDEALFLLSAVPHL